MPRSQDTHRHLDQLAAATARHHDPKVRALAAGTLHRARRCLALAPQETLSDEAGKGGNNRGPQLPWTRSPELSPMRDQFAAAALAGIMKEETNPTDAAEAAYRYADAMLVARSEPVIVAPSSSVIPSPAAGITVLEETPSRDR